MIPDNDISAPIDNASPASASPVRVAMQQSEQSAQPLYANFTALSAGQSVVIVNFGFIDSQAVHALQHKLKAGENLPTHLSARMSCRVALSSHAIHQLTQQLGQVLNRSTDIQTPADQKGITQPVAEQAPNHSTATEKTTEAPSHSSGGFRFPWSKK